VATNQPLDPKLKQLIAGAVAEIDREQLAITRRLTPAQRFQKAISMIRIAEQVATYRLRLRQPHLSESEARRLVRTKEAWRKDGQG